MPNKHRKFSAAPQNGAHGPVHDGQEQTYRAIYFEHGRRPNFGRRVGRLPPHIIGRGNMIVLGTFPVFPQVGLD